MSLSLDDLKAEIGEYHNRIEEVLSGMDRVLAQMDRRIATLEEQLGTLAAAVTDEADLLIAGPDIAPIRKNLKGKE